TSEVIPFTYNATKTCELRDLYPVSRAAAVVAWKQFGRGVAMKAKGVVAVLAGQASIVAILVLVLVLSYAGAPLVQQKKVVAQRMGAEFALTKADAIAEALLASDAGERKLDQRGQAFTARHLKHALTAPPRDTAPRGFPIRAVAALKAHPDQPHIEF